MTISQSKYGFDSLSVRFSKHGKVSFGELRAENHLDRQGVVGFFPLGSDSAPFGSTPVFLAVSGRFFKSTEKSFLGTQG